MLYRWSRLLRRHARDLLFALVDPRCGWLSKLAVLVGIGYLFVPWDIISDRTPYIGHLDEATFLLGGLAVGGLLAPDTMSVFGQPGRPPHGMALQRANAALIGWWLGARRRPRRIARRSAVTIKRKRARTSPIRYRRHWLLQAPFVHSTNSSPLFIVIGGAGRSGTTLLRTILGRHPLIASGPETTVFLSRISSPHDLGPRLGWDERLLERWLRQSRSQVEFIGMMQGAMRERTGKPFWAEKTPANVRRFGFIRQHFPNVKLVHIIRDGRDVACSLRRKSFAKIDGAVWNSAAATQRCGALWRRDVLADDDEVMAAGKLSTTSVGRWTWELSPADVAALRGVIGPLLIDLGYAQNLQWRGLRGPSE